MVGNTESQCSDAPKKLKWPRFNRELNLSDLLVNLLWSDIKLKKETLRGHVLVNLIGKKIPIVKSIGKIHIFSDGHQILRQSGQIYNGDFAKFCGLLRIYEL